MCDKKQKVALSDLILEAVCYLQEKNGVTACEIAEFIAKTRGCKISQIEGMVKMILCKAKSHGILSDKKGLYKIEDRYDDAVIQAKKEGNKSPVELSEEDTEEEGDEEEDEEAAEEKKKCDPCACLNLSQENLSDDEEDNRCGAQKPKKRKCC